MKELIGGRVVDCLKDVCMPVLVSFLYMSFCLLSVIKEKKILFHFLCFTEKNIPKITIYLTL